MHRDNSSCSGRTRCFKWKVEASDYCGFASWLQAVFGNFQTSPWHNRPDALEGATRFGIKSTGEEKSI